MNNFHKNLNYAFIGGIVGLILTTWMAPEAIGKLFTPPAEFGAACQPVGAWLMQKLIVIQALGLLFGIFFTLWIKFKFTPCKAPADVKKD